MDITGKEIMNYSKKNMSTGVQTISFEIRNLHNGMYFYTMNIDGNKSTGKLYIVK